jgi:hypothetical protein
MAIVVEDGSIVTGANSYVSESDLSSYASARGINLSGDPEELLIKAMDYIESLSYIGIKFSRDQELQWPRVDVWIDDYYLDSDTIPQQLKNGLMITAIEIDSGNNPISTISTSDQTKRKRVGDIEVEYKDGASSSPIIRSISSALYKLLDQIGSVRVSKA